MRPLERRLACETTVLRMSQPDYNTHLPIPIVWLAFLFSIRSVDHPATHGNDRPHEAVRHGRLNRLDGRDSAGRNS